MAMVLDAMASYLQNMLKELMKEEVHMLLGVKGEINKMDIKLGDLKNFLADAERRCITDKSVQGWVGELKRAMYSATDILDMCRLKAVGSGTSAIDVGCFNPLLFCLQNPIHAHDIGRRIKALNRRLDAIKERSAAFSFINLGSYEERRTARPAGADRKTDPVLERSCVVGDKIEEDTRALVEKLTKGEDSIMVVAIVGIGGIGKTTLSKKVFNDESIDHEFKTKIWLSVTQDYNETELLRTAIIAANGDLPRSGVEDKSLLVPALANAIRDKKFFLVLDDMWSDREWNSLLKAPFSHGGPSSRVLVTTRHDTVAQGMRAVHPYHHVEKLGLEDAWSLLRNQIVSSDIDKFVIDDMLKDIGMEIIAKCGGLPLALKVTGGLLCKKERKRAEWEKVLNRYMRSVSEIPQELSDALYWSYEDLPSCLKQCFLHYSLLPTDTDFYNYDIVGMWISEGFIYGNSDELEELGKECYNELILRNLIEPDTSYVSQCVCSMHDVVRAFAQYVARDEALAAHNGENDDSKLNSQNLIRMSIKTKGLESDETEWIFLKQQKSLRTLIAVGPSKIQSGDSLLAFSCLRTLHIQSAKVAALVESFYQLKHLRYLSIQHTDVSILPETIGKMIFLQHICLRGCQSFVELPHSIIKLGQLRYLNLIDTSITCIPRGFGVLTNLRRLHGFPVQVDGDWCSLKELAHLSKLRALGLGGMENISASASTTTARLDEKVHLIELALRCTSRLGDGGLVKEEEGASEQEQRLIEKGFDELCPPVSLEHIHIGGYFGLRLPKWMMSTSVVLLKSLRVLMMTDLACCTQLPDGLCQLPCLQFIQIRNAPAIKRVGSEFLQDHHHSDHPSQVVPAFMKLNELNFSGMLEWEEWEWEENLQAMPVLELLSIKRCKLKHFPSGLASHARALRKIRVYHVQHLNSLENFLSLVELEVFHNPDLERITNLPNVLKLTIVNCPKLKILESVPAIQRLVLEEYTMETLPEYMQDINPRHLQLDCRAWLLASVAAGRSGLEWDKFSHVEHVKAYAHDAKGERKWYVLYTRDPYTLETNVSHSFISAETLLFPADAQRFASVPGMTRRTFNCVCNLVKMSFLEDMMTMGSNCTFLHGRVLSLEDRVAIALRVLASGSPMETLVSSVGVHQSTVSLVTSRFVEAMLKRASHHLRWPDSTEMEKIKSKFDKVHGLPQCCGVVDTAHITILSLAEPNCEVWLNHENSYSIQVQAVVDPDMRFIDIAAWPGSTKQPNILHGSNLFQLCEKGAWLNGSKLKVSDGLEVREFIIGDAEYRLLPWLLTPYQEKDLSDSKAEFNRRHSSARTIVMRALARFKDTWKYLNRVMWCPANPSDLVKTINVCCMLHNMMIDMEDASMEETCMPSEHEINYSQQVCQLADENAIRARDILSQHLTARTAGDRSSESAGDEEEQVVSADSRD